MLFYVLECKVEHCTAEFYLNDIPVIRRGPDIGDAFGGPVNHLLVDGVNCLEMVIEPGPTPAEALKGVPDSRRPEAPPENARAQAALTTYPKGAVVEGPDREELVSMEWQAEEGTPCFFPRVCATTYDLGPVYGRWQWQDAERITLDDATLRDASDFVIGLHGSMAIGDFEPYIQSGRTRNAEFDRIYEKAPGATAGQFRNMRADCIDDPYWGMAQLSSDTFSLRLCAHDRLVECISNAWQPVLEELPDQEESIMRYPMMIGKIDGEWQILR